MKLLDSFQPRGVKGACSQEGHHHHRWTQAVADQQERYGSFHSVDAASTHSTDPTSSTDLIGTGLRHFEGTTKGRCIVVRSLLHLPSPGYEPRA